MGVYVTISEVGKAANAVGGSYLEIGIPLPPNTRRIPCGLSTGRSQPWSWRIPAIPVMSIKSNHVFQLIEPASGSQKPGMRQRPSTPSTQLFVIFWGFIFSIQAPPFPRLLLQVTGMASLSIFATVHNNTQSFSNFKTIPSCHHHLPCLPSAAQRQRETTPARRREVTSAVRM